MHCPAKLRGNRVVFAHISVDLPEICVFLSPAGFDDTPPFN